VCPTRRAEFHVLRVASFVSSRSNGPVVVEERRRRTCCSRGGRLVASSSSVSRRPCRVVAGRRRLPRPMRRARCGRCSRTFQRDAGRHVAADTRRRFLLVSVISRSIVDSRPRPSALRIMRRAFGLYVVQQSSVGIDAVSCPPLRYPYADDSCVIRKTGST